MRDGASLTTLHESATAFDGQRRISVGHRRGLVRTVWDTGNNLVCLGGNRDTEMLSHLSDLIGHRDVTRETRSSGRGDTSFSQSITREPILDVSRLAALPPVRAILSSSGNRPVMIQPPMAFASPRANDIKKAEENYLSQIKDPAARAQVAATINWERTPANA